jgi:hypothetical protein
MSVFLSPVFNDQQLDVNGDPLTGGRVYTYLAGSSTPVASYTSASGLVSQANPVILNSLGAPTNPIWLLAGLNYKLVLQDASGVTLRTIDNVAGVNDAALSVSEWVESGFVPTFLSATTFSVPGDQTLTLQAGRRIRSINSGGTIYSSIVSAVFASSVTTITTQNDSGVLDAGLSAVSYGFTSSSNNSVGGVVPRGGIVMWSGSASAIPAGWWLCDGANGTPNLVNRFVVGASGTYAVGATGGSADAIVVAHTHTGTTASDGIHSHTLPGQYLQNNAAGGGIASGSGVGVGTATDLAGTHTHTFTTDSTGASGVNANLPPYYALCFIMRA